MTVKLDDEGWPDGLPVNEKFNAVEVLREALRARVWLGMTPTLSVGEALTALDRVDRQSLPTFKTWALQDARYAVADRALRALASQPKWGMDAGACYRFPKAPEEFPIAPWDATLDTTAGKIAMIHKMVDGLRAHMLRLVPCMPDHFDSVELGHLLTYVAQSRDHMLRDGKIAPQFRLRARNLANWWRRHG